MVSPASPPKPSYRGADPDGFANPTVFKRWPVILDQVIDDLRQSQQSSDVCQQIAQVQMEIVKEKPMPDLLDDHEPDYKQWNEAVNEYFPNTSYSKASWLFAECYLYRRIWNIIKCSSSKTDYDPFHSRKKTSLSQSFSKMISSSKRLLSLMSSRSPIVTRDLLLMSLWGNATDLSMFAGLSQSEMDSMTASSGEENIISNDLDQVCDFLDKQRDGCIDFILDNSGFELFGDFLLADHLHRIGVATKTVFHCKSIPWFVSDTTQNDVEELLTTMENPSLMLGNGVHDVEELLSFAKTWRGYLARGEWVLRSSQFWTSWWAYCHLPQVDPGLFSELSKSSLVIFKGDLNYRKLIYDCRWPSTTPFKEAIGRIIADSLPLVALRTNKSDPCVGLPSGKEQELLDAGYQDWSWSGKFAIVQFSCPRGQTHC